MLPLSERPYLKKNLLIEYENDPGIELDQAAWYLDSDLRNADFYLSLSEEELQRDYKMDYPYCTHKYIIDSFDRPIKGTGQGIELDPVIVPKEYKFLGDVMSKMPLDVMIYKGKSGIGGTTLAIEDSRKWIICVGSKDIVKTKSKKHKNTLGVYAMGHGGASNLGILSYTGNTIFTTWSSLNRVMENINIEKWSLLIDENQELIRDGSFRSGDINNIFRKVKDFKYVTLISATEIDKPYYLGYFKNIDILRFSWEKKKYYNIDVIETNYLIRNIAQLCKSSIEDPELPNKHIFFNSVEGIIKVVLILEKVFGKDLSDEISIITSDKSTNIEKISKIGKGKYKLGELHDVKRINFYTSTSFSGVDIEDNNGDIIIAVNGKLKHTRLDLKKDILQIIGRIRNPRNGMKIYLLFTRGDKRKIIDVKDYGNSLSNQIKDAKNTVKWYNELTKPGKALPKNKVTTVDNPQLQLIDGEAKINAAYFLYQKSSYHKNNTLYTKHFTAIKEHRVTQGDEIFTFNNDGEGLRISQEIAEADTITKVKRGASFKSNIKDFLEEMDVNGWKQTLWDSEKPYHIKKRNKLVEGFKNSHDALFEKYTFLEDALLNFSPDQIREIGLNIKDIKTALGKKQGESNIKILRNNLNIEVGVKYSSEEISGMLKKEYNRIGIEKSDKATYIKKIFPYITFKNYNVDKEVEIAKDEYWRIKRLNQGKSKGEKISIRNDFDKYKYYKIDKKGGKKKLYVLPYK